MNYGRIHIRIRVCIKKMLPSNFIKSTEKYIFAVLRHRLNTNKIGSFGSKGNSKNLQLQGKQLERIFWKQN